MAKADKVSKELEDAIKDLVKSIKKSADMTLEDKCKILTLALNLEKVKQKAEGDDWGGDLSGGLDE